MHEFVLGVIAGVSGYELIRQWWTGAFVDQGWRATQITDTPPFKGREPA